MGLWQVGGTCPCDFKKPQEVHLEYNLHPNKNYKKEKKNEVKSNLKT
jgi:hypothetical protein